MVTPLPTITAQSFSSGVCGWHCLVSIFLALHTTHQPARDAKLKQKLYKSVCRWKELLVTKWLFLVTSVGVGVGVLNRLRDRLLPEFCLVGKNNGRAVE